MAYTSKQMEKHKNVMHQGEPIPVELVNFYGKKTNGALRFLKISESESNMRALKFLLICVGAAFVAIIIPPHIPWFLGLITAGFIGYAVKKREKEFIAGGEAHCPSCQAFQVIGKSSAEFPILHYCSECRARSDIYKEGQVPIQDN